MEDLSASKVFLYALRCVDGSYYVGSTTQPEHRILSHFAGVGSVHTKNYRPVSLEYLVGIVYDNWDTYTKQEAALRRRIKTGKSIATLNLDVVTRINRRIEK